MPACRCLTADCMAWHVVHPEHRREDHSGASGVMVTEGSRTNRIARREGGPGSMGFWVLDEVGVCSRMKQE